MSKKQVIGGPIVIGGRTMTVSKAIRAGDMVYVTGQIPFKDGAPMTTGSIEEQTRATIEGTAEILKEAGCELTDVVKSMVWLRDKGDFPGFNQVYGEYFPNDPPTRSAVLGTMLVDVRLEIEVIAYKPL